MENCVQWLKWYLSAGASECGAVRDAAREAGYSMAELKAARQALRVKTWHQVDTLESPRVDNWFWYLPCGQP